MNPLYMDTTGDSPDYSLQLASRAIDRCSSSGPQLADLFGGSRPYDDARPDIDGPYDAGAIEYSNDPVFANTVDLAG